MSFDICKDFIESIKVLGINVNLDKINKACEIAYRAHDGQVRLSGEPYIAHPIEVARIVLESRLDTDSICTAILHDVIEDTDVTLDDIRKNMGDSIAFLADGVTKLSQIRFNSQEAEQAENFRKLFLALSKDIRVLLIKLADRLHNMRTLHYHPKPEKQKRIARETLEVYAPLAERIGWQDVKTELENISFGYIYTDALRDIELKLVRIRENEPNFIASTVDDIKSILDEAGIKGEVSGREKTPYSIWRKMMAKGTTVEQMSDVIAFRVIVDDISDCYAALGHLHAKWRMIPRRFKDFISLPKPNGYKSIHTTVLSPNAQAVEIQIRTSQMHEVNEHGVAAHWQYKQKIDFDKSQQYWVKEILGIIEAANSSEEFLEHTKMALFTDKVFCFTPSGDVISLPRGATPIDFAYAVHTKVGDTCAGAKINGKMVPLRTQLNTGDRVEIITSKNQTPSASWENFVVTATARSRIRRFIRLAEKEKAIELGKMMLEKAFDKEGIDYNQKTVNSMPKLFNLYTLDDFFGAVGIGHIPVENAFEASGLTKNKVKRDITLEKAKSIIETYVNKASNQIKEKKRKLDVSFEMAKCCRPLVGENIIGVVQTGKGIKVHLANCEVLKEVAPERYIDVSWEELGVELTNAKIILLTNNVPEVLPEITNIIVRAAGRINSFKTLQCENDIMEIYLEVGVKSSEHLGNIIVAINANKYVISVNR